MDTHQNKRSKRRILWIALLLVLWGISLFIFYKSADLGYTYSWDHKKFIDAFGPPKSFIIAYNIKENGITKKIETWKYPELDEIFVFNNGEFITRKHYNFDLPEGKKTFSLQLEPKDYYNFKTISDLEKILETWPTATTEINKEILGKTTKYYEYDQWLDAGEYNGKLVYINQKCLSNK